MTRKVKFREAFWGADFCSASGIEALITKFKDGTKTCKGMEEFLRQRAKAEEEYGKQLIRASKLATVPEMGSIVNTWDQLMQETEADGHEHMQASIKIYEIADRLSSFIDKQKGQKKHDEDQVKKSLKKKIDLYKKTAESKKTYERCSSELDLVESQVNSMKQAIATVPTKDYDKANKKHQKCITDEKNADHSYRTNVDNLQSARIQWEQDMSRACDTFEMLEEKRLSNLRNELWVFANVISITSVSDDQHAEKIRLSLEKCNFDHDIELFIADKRTGNEKPEPVEFHEHRRQGRTGRPPPSPRTLNYPHRN